MLPVRTARVTNTPNRIKIACTRLFLAFLLCSFNAFASDTGLDFFEKSVRPVLVDHCYKCHSSQSEKGHKGGLLLDTKEAVLKGGDSGPAIVSGDPEKSLLIKAIRYTDKDLQMPPKGKKLSAEEISNLEAWVKMGAPDPRTGTTNDLSPDSIAAKAKKHWAFQPVQNPTPPAVKNKAFPRTAIDKFILAELEENQIKPSPQADKRTLIRRAYYDLTGLPPTYEEVERFTSDRSSDAFEKVVDRLLASPRYGERWARHWLDVARYADTKGYLAGNEERRFPYSYTYRDWVINALNDDLPFDQFIIQQIAADQLELKEDKRPLAAMGFLTLGRRFLNNKHDIIDDRIDVVTRGMLGLTVACARCHDHKYDPIPAKDYYSFYGVFNSSREPSERPLLGTEPPADLRDQYIAEKKRREVAVETFKETKANEIMTDLRRRVGDYILAAHDTEKLADKSQSDSLARQRNLHPTIVARWITGLGKWKTTTNANFAPWFDFTTLPEAEFSTKAKDLAAQYASTNSTPNPHIAQLFTNAPTTLKEVAERYNKLFSDVDKVWQEIVAAAAKTTNSPPTTLADAHQEALRQMIYGSESPINLSAGEIESLYDVPSIEQGRELRRQVAEIDATHPGAPPRAMALVDDDTPANAHVFIRGNPGNPGPQVPRQFLEILSGPERKPFQKGSGRLELAQAIASPTNPLTARVIVNRIWLQHFGKGLVDTPSDFGLRSDPPSHPELLDWLASNFVKNGWSLKKLHREIMLSSVYQQRSDDNANNARIDPNNKLFGKMNRRRADFEALRDSMLATSGKLDLSTGGQPIDLTTEPFSGRRSVYGFIDRQNLPAMFRTFDFASPDTTSAQRFYTTVPQQALFLLNSPFVVEQARALATNTLSQKARRDHERVEFLYERLFQREPERDEINSAVQFLKVQRDIAPAPVNTLGWEYGFGEFDEATKRVKAFHKFPHWNGKRWQYSAELPDPTLAYAFLDVEGGHPGNHPHQAAIRRWISPFDGFVRLEGTLQHLHAGGDGVRGRAVSSRNGLLGTWESHNNEVETIVTKCEVRRGDTIDFIVDTRTGPAHDSFKWTSIVKLSEVKYGTQPPARNDWRSRRDFDGPPPDFRPLTAWEKLAQVLLISNEFVFVD